MSEKVENPIGTDGFEFLEYASPDPLALSNLFVSMGFEVEGNHKNKEVIHFRQNDINFVVNNDPNSHAVNFSKAHGPSVSAMGFRVHDAKAAIAEAVKRGAKEYTGADGEKTFDLPAIEGIGGSVIYFVDQYADKGDIYKEPFAEAPREKKFISSGLMYIDHVTHNVYQGNMDKWANFYESIFNFREIRYFDIKGQYTGLLSRAMTAPCDKIRIPLNEPQDKQSQIQEYLDVYKGEGIQHIALGSADIYSSIELLKADGIGFLDTPDAYYDLLPKRIPNHGEDVDKMRAMKILIDGDLEAGKGLLLQIFTENAIGPVFFEIIQRKGNEGFGEGNFQALFDSMEQEQINRGAIKVD